MALCISKLESYRSSRLVTNQCWIKSQLQPHLRLVNIRTAGRTVFPIAEDRISNGWAALSDFFSHRCWKCEALLDGSSSRCSRSSEGRDSAPLKQSLVPTCLHFLVAASCQHLNAEQYSLQDRSRSSLRNLQPEGIDWQQAATRSLQRRSFLNAMNDCGDCACSSDWTPNRGRRL